MTRKWMLWKEKEDWRGRGWPREMEIAKEAGQRGKELPQDEHKPPHTAGGVESPQGLSTGLPASAGLNIPGDFKIPIGKSPCFAVRSALKIASESKHRPLPKEG